MKPSITFTAAALLTAGILSFVQFSTSDSPTQNAIQVAEATQNQPTQKDFSDLATSVTSTKMVLFMSSIESSYCAMAARL